MNESVPQPYLLCPTPIPVNLSGNIDGFGILLVQPDAADYVLGYDWPFGGKIAELRVGSSLGTGIVSVLINGVAITGLTNVPFSSAVRARHVASALNTFQPGDDIILRINSADLSASNVKATIYFQRL